MVVPIYYSINRNNKKKVQRAIYILVRTSMDLSASCPFPNSARHNFLTCPVQVLESIVRTSVNDEIHLLALATTSTLMDCVECSARESFEMHCNSPDVQLYRATG